MISLECLSSRREDNSSSLSWALFLTSSSLDSIWALWACRCPTCQRSGAARARKLRTVGLPVERSNQRAAAPQKLDAFYVMVFGGLGKLFDERTIYSAEHLDKGTRENITQVHGPRAPSWPMARPCGAKLGRCRRPTACLQLFQFLG